MKRPILIVLMVLLCPVALMAQDQTFYSISQSFGVSNYKLDGMNAVYPVNGAEVNNRLGAVQIETAIAIRNRYNLSLTLGYELMANETETSATEFSSTSTGFSFGVSVLRAGGFRFSPFIGGGMRLLRGQSYDKQVEVGAFNSLGIYNLNPYASVGASAQFRLNDHFFLTGSYQYNIAKKGGWNTSGGNDPIDYSGSLNNWIAVLGIGFSLAK